MNNRLGYAASKLMELFKWGKVALLYYQNELDYCAGVIQDVEAVLNDPTSFPVQIVLKAELSMTNDSSTSNLEAVKSRARSKTPKEELNNSNIFSCSLVCSNGK